MSPDDKALEIAIGTYREIACWPIGPANHRDALRAAILAYESAKQKGEAEGWRTIESAPKDAVIDLWTEPHGRAADAQWSDSKAAWVEWGPTDFDGMGYRRVEGRVVAWRPLPEPPTMLSAGGEGQ